MRDEALGNTLNTGGTPPHYTKFMHLFDYGVHIGTIDNLARRQTGHVVMMDPDDNTKFCVIPKEDGSTFAYNSHSVPPTKNW